MELFQLNLVTPQGTVFAGKVASLQLPTAFGSLGIRRGQEPLQCAVEKGVLRLQLPEGDRLRLRIGSGIVEVSGGEVTVLVSAAELPEEESKE